MGRVATALPGGGRRQQYAVGEGVAHEHAGGSLSGWETGGVDAGENRRELALVGQLDGERAQPDRAGRCRRGAGAVPGVQPDVVVIAARGYEQRAGIAAHDDVEPEHAVVEGLGLAEL